MDSILFHVTKWQEIMQTARENQGDHMQEGLSAINYLQTANVLDEINARHLKALLTTEAREIVETKRKQAQLALITLIEEQMSGPQSDPNFEPDPEPEEWRLTLEPVYPGERPYDETPFRD